MSNLIWAALLVGNLGFVVVSAVAGDWYWAAFSGSGVALLLVSAPE